MAGIDLLNLNASVVYQFALFLLTLFVLSRFLVRPMLATMAERRRRLVPAAEDSGLEAMVKTKEKEYADLLQQVRSAGSKVRSELREAAKADERDILAKAQSSANAQLKKGQAEIGDAVEDARRQMAGEIPVLARELARKILGREVQ